MKTIKNLKRILEILYYILIGVCVLYSIIFAVFYFFGNTLLSPAYFLALEMSFNTFFSLKMILIPLIISANFILLTIAIYFLRKTIPFFMKSDFYNKDVINLFKKVGNIFVFIGISTIISTLYSTVIIQNLTQKETFSTQFLFVFFSSFNLKSIFSITIGLFFLLFSKILENSKELKQENNLTI